MLHSSQSILLCDVMQLVTVNNVHVVLSMGCDCVI